MNTRRMNPVVSGGFRIQIVKYCIGCQNREGYAPLSPRERMMELVKKGISIPQAVSFQARVLTDSDMPHDGTQVYVLDEPKGPRTWFLRETYVCGGTCASSVRVLTLVHVDEGSTLYSVFTTTGIIEVEIKEVIRRQRLQCRYPSGSPELQVVEYLRSMSKVIGYRHLD